MALSSSASGQFSSLVKKMAKNYNVNSVNGFHINDRDVIGYSKQCFSFWEFAKNINIVTVEDRNGESFLSSLGAPVSSRTDVKGYDRQAHNLLADKTEYETSQINTDVYIPFNLINQWAMSEKTFSQQYFEFIQKRIGADRLIAGWHGVGIESNTNPSNDPLLTNVAKGWLKNMITQRPDRVLGASDLNLDISIGEAGMFSNLDSAVLEMISMIPEMYRSDLVCIVGDTLLQDEQNRVYSNNNYLFDKHKNAHIFNSFGNIPRVDCLGFPTTGLVVTSKNNLSIYIKSGTAFRQLESNIKRERVEDYHSSELAFVVENPNAFFALHPACVSVKAMSESLDDMSVIRKLMNEHNANAAK